MAKANAVTGTTLYVPQGAALPGPGELAEEVRLVGPGAPAGGDQEATGEFPQSTEPSGQFAHWAEEGEQPSDGSSSSASTSKPPSSDEPNSPSPRRRAQTTGRRLSKSAGSGSAPSTGGSGPETT